MKTKMSEIKEVKQKGVFYKTHPWPKTDWVSWA
jgi:hypothetical protein